MTDSVFDPANQMPISRVSQLLDELLGTLWAQDAPAELAGRIPPLMLWGAPGIGKSALIRQVAEKYGVEFKDIRLAQREPVDVRGLPVPDAQAKSVNWLISGDWPRDPESRGILFFDELTAADRTMQVAAYELILDRRLGNDYQLPDGWYVCAAGNRVTDRAVATTMSSALANRFLHVELVSNANDWHQWALQRDLHPAVVGFLQAFPQHLFQQENQNLERGWPSPRSWERVSTILQILQKNADNAGIIGNAVCGLVGNGVGTEFLAFLKYEEIGENVRRMLLDPKAKIHIPEQADRIYAMCSAAGYYVCHSENGETEKALLSGLVRLLEALPKDFAALLIIDAIERGKSSQVSRKLLTDPRFRKFLTKFRGR